VAGLIGGARRFGRRRRGLITVVVSIWALATERSYLALVRDRGWRAEDYEDWLTGQLAAALLPW
jgi:hypothetical protein